MKIVPGEQSRFIALQAKSVGTPYRDILTFAERVANAIETDLDFDEFRSVIRELELKTDQLLSIGDVGEIMVLLSNYWVYGERLLEHLTPIEAKIVAENVAYRLSVLSEHAEIKTP